MKSNIKKALLQKPIKPVAGFAYNSIVHLELSLFALADKFKLSGQSPLKNSLDQITALIKTFERPKTLLRLLSSVKRLYPDLHLLVVDDSKNPCPADDIEYHTLPYNSGVSAGRSYGLQKIKTPYTLLLDDDFIFYHKTGLREALAAINNCPEIDIMGGTVIKLPHLGTADYSKATLFPTDKESLYPSGSTIGPFPVFDKVANFYIARTERLRLVNWDPQIKRQDHADFFTRAKGILTTVYNNNLRCLHAQTPFDTHYMQYRIDLEADIKLLRQRYYPGCTSSKL